MKNTIIILLLSVSIGTSIGCNTTKGLGKDIENTGRNIQDTIDKNQ